MLSKQNIYMIGIGGIGMSALARYFKYQGKNVAGYDRVQSSLCQALQAEGIAIHYTDAPNDISPEFLDRDKTIVIYTAAIPAEMQEFQYFKEKGFTILKRAQALGEISKNHTCLAVAGTHGKTTTSALLAHMFKNAGHSITAFLGGIAVNYQSNFIAGKESNILIAEADEYDRSFLQLNPAGGIITSIDADHLDIYGQAETIKKTFSEFRNKIADIAIVQKNTGLEGITYSIDGDSEFSGTNLRISNHRYYFDLEFEKEVIIKDIPCGLAGRHNVENAIGAAALALNFGLSPEEVKAGIETFKGVKRRFEYHIKSEKLVYIDDYAHHPAEIQALISSVRELYPNKKITGIFQPHLYSRTRDFADEFGNALSKLDGLILMDIYPAREKPMAGIDSAMVLEKVKLTNKQLLSTSEILGHFTVNKAEIVLTIGAGDIDQLVEPLKDKLLA